MTRMINNEHKVSKNNTMKLYTLICEHYQYTSKP